MIDEYKEEKDEDEKERNMSKKSKPKEKEIPTTIDDILRFLIQRNHAIDQENTQIKADALTNDTRVFIILLENFIQIFSHYYINHPLEGPAEITHWRQFRYIDHWTDINSGGFPTQRDPKMLVRFAKNPQFRIDVLENKQETFKTMVEFDIVLS